MRNVQIEVSSFIICILFLVFGLGVVSTYSQHTESIKRGILETPRIYLNLSGFSLEAPKRFTAPSLEDGTSFFILRKEVGDIRNIK